MELEIKTRPKQVVKRLLIYTKETKTMKTLPYTVLNTEKPGILAAKFYNGLTVVYHLGSTTPYVFFDSLDELVDLVGSVSEGGSRSWTCEETIRELMKWEELGEGNLPVKALELADFFE
jgi:hypothetical protein